MDWKHETLEGGHIKATRVQGPVQLTAMASRYGGAWLITLNGEKIANNVGVVKSLDIDVAIQACEAVARTLTAAFTAMGYAPVAEAGPS
jgi:hypothetical protein